LVGLQDKARARVRDLSRGMQQKLSIAVSLINNPKLLLLDEPTNGLDVEAAEQIKELLRDRAGNGLAILLTTHQLDVAQEIADYVSIIRGGKIIAESSTEDLLSRFSGTAYVIRFDGDLGTVREALLYSLDASIEDNSIYVRGNSDLLYEVLDIVRPNNILEVSRDDADLTQIFLTLIKEGD
jgi:ABC-2 type transport system ATP-binding protein